jgi:FAD/FMN-containing dehydrogenase
MDESLLSWGRWPRPVQRRVPVLRRDRPLPPFQGRGLPRGNGRSYGDSCLAADGDQLAMRTLDRFIAFDPTTGVLRCEAGVLLDEIIALALPKGWFLPVTPGTRFVTVGGAIANDVHGKNHHRAGSFGEHLRAFELLRSDGARRVVSPQTEPEWFAATVGGLGLTGAITWAELQLKPVPGPWIAQEVERFEGLDDFFALSEAANARHEYTVAWVDCIARGRNVGRGVFFAGDHAEAPAGLRERRRRSLSVPFSPPISPVNALTLRAFNGAYFALAPAQRKRSLVHCLPFFYPLDAVLHWNRAYGRAGFLQYQCVVPPAAARYATHELLATIAASGQGSFLVIVKTFGQHPSRGMLSFARPGTTLALDFPNRGAATLTLLERLDRIVADARGALYPGKDARMSRHMFELSFPQLDRFLPYVDPRLASHFWQRVRA